MVTGIIVLKIIEVYRKIKPAVDETLGASTSDGGSVLRSVIFVIIESGVALLATQLFRVYVTVMQATTYRLVIGINQMMNVKNPPLSIHSILLMLCPGSNTHNHPSADLNEIVIL